METKLSLPLNHSDPELRKLFQKLGNNIFLPLQLPSPKQLDYNPSSYFLDIFMLNSIPRSVNFHTEQCNQEGITSKKRSKDEEKKEPKITKRKKSEKEEECEEKEFGDQVKLQGEQRLIIDFESFGTLGKTIQRMGKNGNIVPDGLRGTHTVYHERWRFEINHGSIEDGLICLIWKITNLSTNEVFEMQETKNQARQRSNLGWTISSKVFRVALEAHIRDLSEQINSEDNSNRRANLQNLRANLNPKRFNSGLLIFGLHHRIVQQKMEELLKAEMPLSAQ